MRKQSPLEKLNEAQGKAAQRKQELLKRLHERPLPAVNSSSPAEIVSPGPDDAPHSEAANQQALPSGLPLERNALAFFGRADPTEHHSPQPWALKLTELALRAATQGGIHLCLVWPVALTSIVPIHALATLYRNLTTDLRGLRTLLFPGNWSSGLALQGWIVDRKPLAQLFRTVWSTDSMSPTLRCLHKSDSMLGVLHALNYIENEDADLPDPSLAEIVPTFLFDPTSKSWISHANSPLERTLSKVSRVSYRRHLRQIIKPEWANRATAPGALFVMHNTARKEHWKAALSDSALRGDARPELLMLDATGAAGQSNYSAVKHIPDFLHFARGAGYQDRGALLITDDPATFFELRARFAKISVPLECHSEAAEGSYSLLSPCPLPDHWHPEQKTNTNFSVGIVDRDASSVAIAFAKYAQELGGDGTSAGKALSSACLYLLRLSNLPAGYQDLTAAGLAGDLDEYSAQQHQWVAIDLSIRSAVATGLVKTRQAEIDRLLVRANGLIDSWKDATPMAARLSIEVGKHALNSKDGLAIVLPNQRYISLASRYLARTLGDDWARAEPRITWHTLATVGKTLNNKKHTQHVAFVGVNRSVLRILLADPHIPNGTIVLIAYRQADSTLRTLRGLKTLDAFKAYRGRIGLLIQELERRLQEFPQAMQIDRVRGSSLLFNWSKPPNDRAAHSEYFTFTFEDGSRTYSPRWVYQFDAAEDPPFRRAPADTVRVGDFIFSMSDSLRGQIEAALHLSPQGSLSSIVDPARAFLKLYHDDLQARCKASYSMTSRRALAREIHARMVEIDSRAQQCRSERVEYWLDIHGEDNRPHASGDPEYFKLFCRALQIDDATALHYWRFVKAARNVNQHLGRILAAQYAEILFHPESATVYRKIPADVASRLKQEALRCVARVEGITAPENALMGVKTDDGREQRSTPSPRRLQRSRRR